MYLIPRTGRENRNPIVSDASSNAIMQLHKKHTIMSTTIHSTLQMHVFTFKNALSHLKENLQTDADFNGDNGSDYLDDEAEGYDSNLEYYLEKFWLKHKPNDADSLELFFDKFFGFMQKRDQYYNDIQFDLKFIGNQIVLAVMMECEC